MTDNGHAVTLFRYEAFFFPGKTAAVVLDRKET